MRHLRASGGFLARELHRVRPAGHSVIDLVAVLLLLILAMAVCLLPLDGNRLPSVLRRSTGYVVAPAEGTETRAGFRPECAEQPGTISGNRSAVIGNCFKLPDPLPRKGRELLL
jgi:hypothetical protein